MNKRTSEQMNKRIKEQMNKKQKNKRICEQKNKRTKNKRIINKKLKKYRTITIEIEHDVSKIIVMEHNFKYKNMTIMKIKSVKTTHKNEKTK